MMLRHILLSAATIAALPSALLAQAADPATPATPATPQGAAPLSAAPASDLPDANDQRDTLTIGAGGAVLPDYEGSNDYRVVPFAAVRGRYKGVNFSTRGTYLYVDLVPRGSGHLAFNAGPIAGVRLNRKGKIDDPFVRLLPKRKAAFEVGGFAGISYHGLTNPYDSLSARVDVVRDVGDAHRSTIISPTIDFSTPLSRRTYVGLSAGLDYVSSRYARYYFGVTPADALASGLPAFTPRGGLKDWRVGLLANQSITGDLLHGLSIFGTGNYSRLLRDFKRSPIVSQRGKAGQWLGAVGLAYTF